MHRTVTCSLVNGSTQNKRKESSVQIVNKNGINQKIELGKECDRLREKEFELEEN